VTSIDLGARGLIALVVISAVSTLAALAIFRRFSDGAAIRRTGNRIIAHLMELGLFFDEPTLVLGAQADLLRANFKLMRLIALPCALLAVPFAILFLELDHVFGRAPLVVDAPVVITIEWPGPSPVIDVPPGIEVETPAVRAMYSRQVSWRIRPVQAVRDRVKITLPDHELTTPVFAGTGLVYELSLWNQPIRIPYPRATILHLDWMVWYILASVVTAVAWTASQG
jgi:hypothetical protein